MSKKICKRKSKKYKPKKYNKKHKNIEQQRLKEKAKYEALLMDTQYGSTNHGKQAYDLVLQYNPSFVIDFGCGRNNFIQHLKTKNIKGIGLDLVFPEADKICPMHNTGIEDNCADLITAFDSLEHLLEYDVDLVFEEMHRIAKKDCKFIFSICTRQSIRKSLGEHLHPTVKPISWWKEKILKYANIENDKYKSLYIIGSFKK